MASQHVIAIVESSEYVELNDVKLSVADNWLFKKDRCVGRLAGEVTVLSSILNAPHLNQKIPSSDMHARDVDFAGSPVVFCCVFHSHG